MILGFIPKVKRKYKEITMCRNIEESRSIRHHIQNISILITWMLEDACEMGKSMKGRGYGLSGRTRYTIFRFTKRDAGMLAFMIIAGVYVITGSVRGAIEWNYYPVTMGAGFDIYSLSVYVVYVLLCMFPVVGESVRNIKEVNVMADDIE